MYSYIYINIHTYKFQPSHEVHQKPSTYMYIFMQTYILYIHIYACIYMYIHTYIHTNQLPHEVHQTPYKYILYIRVYTPTYIHIHIYIPASSRSAPNSQNFNSLSAPAETKPFSLGFIDTAHTAPSCADAFSISSAEATSISWCVRVC